MHNAADQPLQQAASHSVRAEAGQPRGPQQMQSLGSACDAEACLAETLHYRPGNRLPHSLAEPGRIVPMSDTDCRAFRLDENEHLLS